MNHEEHTPESIDRSKDTGHPTTHDLSDQELDLLAKVYGFIVKKALEKGGLTTAPNDVEGMDDDYDAKEKSTRRG